MIRVARHRNDERGRPIRPSKTWLAKATKLTKQALREGPAHVVNKHYGHNDVRMALEKLFHAKCAYCETPLTEGWNVDHHRPKSA